MSWRPLLIAIPLAIALAGGCAETPSKSDPASQKSLDSPQVLAEANAYAELDSLKDRVAHLKYEMRLAENVSCRLLHLPLKTSARLHLDLLDLSDHQRGYGAGEIASADADANNLNLFTGGLSLNYRFNRQWVRERYGILVIHAADCIGDDGMWTFIRAYNEVSENQIKRRFGNDFFERIDAESVAAEK